VEAWLFGPEGQCIGNFVEIAAFSKFRASVNPCFMVESEKEEFEM
jgi:hypothetical protein